MGTMQIIGLFISGVGLSTGWYLADRHMKRKRSVDPTYRPSTWPFYAFVAFNLAIPVAFFFSY